MYSDKLFVPPGERGAALIVSLVMLLAMTILGVTAARTTTLQERMAGNLRQSAIAFEAAEATLRHGEEWVSDQVGGPRPQAVAPSSCATPPCNVLTLNDLDPMADSTWGGSDVRENPDIQQVASDPEYFVEQQQIVRDSLNLGQSTDESARIYYRVTARSVGETTSAVSILRSTYAARF
jgi:type IV pilus assembly protein PilX